MSVRVAAISIDVDSLHHYLAIHGLSAPAPDEDPIYTVAMPRFFALLEEVGVPATVFLIGRDVGPHLEGLRVARRLGCEIASHSYSHDYRLFERSRAEIRRDYDYLLRLWNQIRETTLNSIAPALVHEEGDLIKRTIRERRPEILLLGMSSLDTPESTAFLERVVSDSPLDVAILSAPEGFSLQDVQRVLPPWLVHKLSALGVLVYAGTGVVSFFTGYGFLDYAALSPHHPVHGQHYGIILVELGVGITVTGVMITIYYAFTSRTPVMDDEAW